MGFLGVSLGGSVGILVAAERHELSAGVVESAFSSQPEVIARFGKLFYYMPRVPLLSITTLFAQLRLGVWFKQYLPKSQISRIAPRAIFVIQDAEDVRMPVIEGETLFNAAREPKEYWLVPGADHGEAYSREPVEYEKRVLDFYATYLK
jgi:fermentation-respiration switch protein FrsA (DUF1100 family)